MVTMCLCPRDCFSLQIAADLRDDSAPSNNKKACSQLVFLVGENGEGSLHDFGAGKYQNKIHALT
jgi:hypothetical protein